jgi:hypothetical protein
MVGKKRAWEKLHIEVLYDISRHQISFGWVGQVTCVQAKRNAYRALVGKLEGRAPRGRP